MPAVMLLAEFGRPTAYAPAILIVSTENGPTSHAWSTHGERCTCMVAGGLMVWPPVVDPLGGACKLATNRYSGQSVAWTIRTAVHPCWTFRLVDNLQVDTTTIHQIFGSCVFLYYEKINNFLSCTVQCIVPSYFCQGVWSLFSTRPILILGMSPPRWRLKQSIGWLNS